jgi:hypothetical protein
MTIPGPDERGGIAADGVGAGRFPEGAAGAGVQGQEEAVQIMIFGQEQLVVEEDRGAAGAVFVLERAHRLFPDFLPSQVVTDQPVAAEHDKDPLPITGRRRRRRIARGGMILLQALRRGDLLPEHFAGVRVQSDGGEFTVR